MHQVRLIRRATVAVALLTVLGACGDGDGGGAIEENVVRPGITAIDNATSLACGSDAESLRTAIDQYTMLEGDPPVDEAALVTAGYLRRESELFDISAGQIVAVDPDCAGSAPTAVTAPVTDVGGIVTSTEPPLTAEEIFAQFTPDEIAQVGGEECARELVEIFAAAAAFSTERGEDPETLDQLVDEGFLDEPIELWIVEGESLVPQDGSGCVDLETADRGISCTGEAKTFQVAIEAYRAMNGADAVPTEAELVDVGYLREENPNLDIVDGAVVAVAGGACEGVDLELATPSG